MSTNGINHLKRSISEGSPTEIVDDNDENQEQQGRQRSRAACAPCRQRKRKCDGRTPCGTCVRYEYNCEYISSKRAIYMPNGDVAQEPPATAPVGDTLPNIIQLQAHPLTAPGARFHHRGILDPNKTRYVRANSAIAFPRILGMDLESESIPRLHSFAWHLGIRREPPEPLAEITSLLTWADMQHLARAYFKFVKPEFGLLEEPDFMEQASARFAQPQNENDFDAVVLGVAALGSFFSPNPHPAEESFVYRAARVLDQKGMVRSPTSNNVSGWILRTIYLRLMSRPHSAWLASSIAMHQVEACGLHKEMQTIAVVYPAAPTGDHKLAKQRRRLFWITRALNIILSFEYGRSRVTFDVVTTKRFAPDSGGFGHQFVELAELLPNDLVDKEREPDPPAALSTALTKLEEMKSGSSFINLLKADLAFAIYRRLWLMSLTDAKDRAESVINLGKAALSASETFLESRVPWWNVVASPFQFLCTLLAIGTPKSLAHVSDVMNLLHRIGQLYDTHMVREAYNQATALVMMSRKRKERELEALTSLPQRPPFDDDHPSAASVTMMEAPSIDWSSMDLPFEWDVFLNPNLVMSSQQGQSAVDAAFGGQLGF
ncbi:hypothetical protein LTR37_014574 [Vermiconidia calcicola]|uniref:Uncharacterized protein n=1 Tax=Vermiconidia calcicola TaxID=1690605 RepID=A0ACC3MUR0_9PEZI|nr:hypothetical protein LTR37_014574 [Vermiconidia calcicola]